MRKTFFCTAFFASFFLVAQKPCPELTAGAQERILQDVMFLAGDDLQGRAPGSEGIEMAGNYLQEQFQQMGVQPPFEGGFAQPFSIPAEVSFSTKNELVFNDEKIPLKTKWFPAQWTKNGTAEGDLIYIKYGIAAPEIKYDDYKKKKAKKLKDKVFVMDVSSPDGIHPHSEYLKHHDLGERVSLAKSKGAAAVILINEEETANDVRQDFTSIFDKGIPVVFVSDDALSSKLKKGKGSVKITVDARENQVQAENIGGWVDNGADRTVVIGAHYDHLGMGGSGSLFKGGEPEIHNGADDNASGVAVMLELARTVSNLDSNREEYEALKKYNYLFVAFSGEEKGLLGSAHFTKHLDELPAKITMMLNLDMVGRLEENLLAVNGVGTSPTWGEIISEQGCFELNIKTSASGTGPSDHTNFYYKNIPALHFFSGTHTDYHKPSDDFEKLNIEGMQLIARYILNLIRESLRFPEMEFTPTKEESMNAPKFSVTLGVMPDYLYQKEGMKIDGVTEGKPASQAGMKAGDVVVKMGEVKVVDMISYMKALGQFKKGDETEVEFLRGEEMRKAKVKF